MGSLINRMIRAAKLDASLYEEVEADPSATTQAMLVVIVSSLAAGVGPLLAFGTISFGFLFNILAALVGWIIWALTTFLIGTKLLPEPQTQADLGQMLRTTGFSSAPGVIRILSILPLAFPQPGSAAYGAAPILALIYFVSWIWMLVAMVVAVRQALDYRSTGRAVGVCLIGACVYLVLERFARRAY